MGSCEQMAAKFAVGQVVRHRKFGYCGVVFDADPCFMGSDEWYQQVALSRPPKDQPWYHVLVDDSETETYVAERNMESMENFQEINHPYVPYYFLGHDNQQYLTRKMMS